MGLVGMTLAPRDHVFYDGPRDQGLSSLSPCFIVRVWDFLDFV